MSVLSTLIRRASMAVLMVLMTIKAFSQSAAGGESYDMPDYIQLLDDGMSPRDVAMSDSLFYVVSQGVVFPVNQFDLDVNSAFITTLRDSVLPRARHMGWELAGMELRGAASPEGSYSWNVILSQRRAKAITDFLQQELGISAAGHLVTSTVAEDYTYLVLMLNEASDPNAQRVADMVQRHGDDVASLKDELKKADGGRLWRYLLRKYFPRLRMARLVLFFRPSPKPLMLPAVDVSLSAPDTLPALPAIASPPLDGVQHEVLERRHALSVSTNLLYDFFYLQDYGFAPMPNVELEFYPRRGKWTCLAAFTSPYYHRWHCQQFFQIRDYHLEARYYFRPTQWHRGWFLSAYANANKYGIGLSATRGWQGEGIGGALKAGYVWRLGRSGRWRIELSAAGGGYVTRFDPYVYGNPVTGAVDGNYYYDYTGSAASFNRRNHRRIWIGPTDVSLKLRYDLLFWRNGKRGVGFKRKEVAR